MEDDFWANNLIKNFFNTNQFSLAPWHPGTPLAPWQCTPYHKRIKHTQAEKAKGNSVVFGVDQDERKLRMEIWKDCKLVNHTRVDHTDHHLGILSRLKKLPQRAKGAAEPLKPLKLLQAKPIRKNPSPRGAFTSGLPPHDLESVSPLKKLTWQGKSEWVVAEKEREANPKSTKRARPNMEAMAAMAAMVCVSSHRMK